MKIFKDWKKEKERKKKEGEIWLVLFLLKEKDNILIKACHKKSARICYTHHIYNLC